MQDLFKKIVYTGVGLVTNTSETLRGSVEDLVKRGKISKEEGNSVITTLQENMTEKYEEFEAGITNVVGVVMDKMNLPTTEGVKAMEKRIKSLEIKIGLLTKELDTKGRKTTAATKKKTTTTRKKATTAAKTVATKATAAVEKTATAAKTAAKKTTTAAKKATATAKTTAKKATTAAKATAKKATKTVKEAVEG